VCLHKVLEDGVGVPVHTTLGRPSAAETVSAIVDSQDIVAMAGQIRQDRRPDGEIPAVAVEVDDERLGVGRVEQPRMQLFAVSRRQRDRRKGHAERGRRRRFAGGREEGEARLEPADEEQQAETDDEQQEHDSDHGCVC